MSYSYIIYSPKDDDKWLMNPEQFSHKLIEKWPSAKFTKPSQDSNYVLEWNISISEAISSFGAIGTNPPLIVIHGGDLSLIAQFVIWCRKLIPFDHELQLLISSNNREPLDLDKTTTYEDIIASTVRLK